MNTMERADRLELELGYRFSDPNLLEKALVHRSYAHERNLDDDNEQLEFLGDAILGFLVSDLLCRTYPTLNEGQLSKLKGFFVSAANLVKYAERIHLGDFLLLGKGEEKTGGRSKPALLVNAFEAVLGALYRDGGMEPALRMVERFFEPQIREVGVGEAEILDFKTALQEALQSKGLGRARYTVAGETGPDHQKLFTVEIRIADGPPVCGVGLTKKAAEQAAAREALETLNRQEVG
ncbi:MAG TPA: ribonuclease III [Terriglobia bacterium]|nr:ribonuclease III [Terriglobia bacterium]